MEIEDYDLKIIPRDCPAGIKIGKRISFELEEEINDLSFNAPNYTVSNRLLNELYLERKKREEE